MAFKKIEPKVWKPENAGDKIEGILVKAEPSVSFESKVYSLEMRVGSQFQHVIVFGTTVLDDRMSYVKVGDKVQIVFKGIEKNKKNQDTKMFDVFIDDGQDDAKGDNAEDDTEVDEDPEA